MFVSFIWLILFVAHIKKSNRSQKFMIYFVAVIFMLYTCHALFFSRLNTPFVDVVYAFANLAVFPMFYIYMKYVTSFSKVKLKWFYTLIPAVVLSGCCALGYIFTPENEIDLFVGGVLYDKNSFFADNQFHFFLYYS